MSKRPWYEGQLWIGMSLGAWLRLLARNRFAVSPSRLPQAAAVTAYATANSGAGLVQRLWYSRRIARMELAPDPLYILGHWRSGTTLLHELLALDPRHRTPTTFECLAPHHFLISEAVIRRWFWFLLPKKRPMDNMRLGYDRPQEDETALCGLGVPSPFLTIAFPNRPVQDAAYHDLRELPASEWARWQARLARFYRSLLVHRHGKLVLKSPQHSFRIPVLAEMFPQMRCVQLVRDPYTVVSSAVHFWWSMYEAYALQAPPYEGIEQYVFETFEQMQKALERDRALIPAENWIDLRYEDLVADPVACLADLYERLELGDFEPARPAIEQYAQRARRYQTNKYELAPEQMEEITRRWLPLVERYGYRNPKVA